MPPDSHRDALVSGMFDALPPVLRGILDGRQLQARPGFTLSLHSVDEAGRPHTTLLSLGEILVPARSSTEFHDSVRFALWPSSRAVANLERSQRGALSCVVDATFLQIQMARVRRLPDAIGLACFAAQVDGVEAQRVAYAELQSGITFMISTEAHEHELNVRWAEQLAVLGAH
jgi:hypothetical protein